MTKKKELNEYVRKENLAKGFIMIIIFCVLLIGSFYSWNNTVSLQEELCYKHYYTNVSNSGYKWICNSPEELNGIRFSYLGALFYFFIGLIFLGGAIYHLFYRK